MQKTTSLKWNIIILFLLFITPLFFIHAQDRSIEFTQQYGSNDHYIGAKSSILNINYKNTSPFIFLSGYTKNQTFNGTAYYQTKNQ